MRCQIYTLNIEYNSINYIFIFHYKFLKNLTLFYLTNVIEYKENDYRSIFIFALMTLDFQERY